MERKNMEKDIRVATLLNIRTLVKFILEEDKKARNSDRYLIKKYYAMKYPDIGDWSFGQVMDTELDSFESIGRARRKLQEEYPHLRGDEETQEKRAEMEEIVREFVR